jgi:hypothetical protein
MRFDAERLAMDRRIRGDLSSEIDPDNEDNTLGSLGAETAFAKKDASWREDLLTTRSENGKTVADGESQELKVSENEIDQSLAQAMLKPRQNLSLALASIADEYLGLDVLNNDRETSKYVAYLLDVIYALHSTVQFQKSRADSPGRTKETEIEAKKKAVDITSRFVVLHRVFCGSNYHNHNASVYEEVPVLTRQTTGLLTGEEILCGKTEVEGIESYLPKHPNIDFVVFKEYRCAPVPEYLAGQLKDRIVSDGTTRIADGISPRQERIKIVSSSLQKVLRMAAECMPDQVLFDDPYEDSWEMEAPYHFLFHHRQTLKDYRTKDPAYRSSLNILLEFLDKNYEKEYEEAQSLFANGEVSLAHVEKLFRPNQVVVQKEARSYRAHILRQWPVKKNNRLILTGWHWQYNGQLLHRQPWHGSLDLTYLHEDKIRNLNICPVEHHDKDIITQLRERGKKFWSLKKQKLVFYDGWDHHHDYVYVSP